MAKKPQRKYGKLPPKNISTHKPGSRICVDCIGPYSVRTKDGDIVLNAMTMIDPETGWFEIAECKNNSSAMTSKLLNNYWLSRYPRPNKIIYDNGPEFKKDFKELCNTYGIKRKPTSIKNPQSNAIIERVHAVIGNMLRTYKLNKFEFDPNDYWSDLLASVAWAIQATYHTVLQASPGQLIFGHNMLLNLNYNAKWKDIQKHHQSLIDKQCETENCHCIDFDWKVDDQALIKVTNIDRKLNSPTEGPYKVLQVYTNGTVLIQRGTVKERINIRWLTPYLTK